MKELQRLLPEQYCIRAPILRINPGAQVAAVHSAEIVDAKEADIHTVDQHHEQEVGLGLVVQLIPIWEL